MELTYIIIYTSLLFLLLLSIISVVSYFIYRFKQKTIPAKIRRDYPINQNRAPERDFDNETRIMLFERGQMKVRKYQVVENLNPQKIKEHS